MTSTDKPKHTPGPWHQRETEEGFRFAVAGDRVVAAENGFIVAMVIHDNPPDAEPNAHLIAAAPELYEACRVALKFWHSDHPNDYPDGIAAHEYIKAAIAKAEGRT